MVKEADGGKEKANEFDIEEELTKIKKENVLPAEIIDKIGDRLKQSKLSVTKPQFYTLIDKIKNTLNQQSPKSKPLNQTKAYTSFPNIEQQANIQNQTEDMKKLVDTIEKLREKIQYLEDNQYTGNKEPTEKKNTEPDTFDSEFGEPSCKEMEPLTAIPNDTERIVVLMKWLQYLVDKIGKQKLPDILGYYVDINWITDDVRLDIINYSSGIVDDQKDEVKKTSNVLSAKDHIQSLLYIQKLKGKKLDDRFICKLDREMEKMIKSIDGYKC